MSAQIAGKRESVVASKNSSEMNSLSEWIKSWQESYVPVGATNAIEREIAQLSRDEIPISGVIADQLIFTRPQLLPLKVWGGGVGLRSQKRMSRLFELLKVTPWAFPMGEAFLVRFQVNPQGWIPHPYNVPTWALDSFVRFSAIHNDKEAFLICKQWEKENNEAADAFVKERLRAFPVQCSATYNSGFTYLDVGILINPPTPELLQANTIWKHETQLAELVKALYPDAVREFSPPWLLGQRLDIYVPSLRVAFEYQGEQHYEPISIFGGEEGLMSRQRQDQRKRELCKVNGVILIEWKFSTPISQEFLTKELSRYGLSS